jgi:hypothetical protein
MQIKREKILTVQLIFLAVFGIAMGFLESAVVVYLRELYYSEGFAFPLKPMELDKLSIEYLREIATLVMLFSLSTVAGRNFPERAAFFLYSFGIWDIFYYVWLKILLDWPSSLWTWDILFLIPVIWIGPVLAPLLCSLTLIFIALFLLYFQQKGYSIKIIFYEWFLLFLGAFAILVTFIWDYSRLVMQRNFISRFWLLGADPEFQNIISRYVPSTYNWLLFALGEALIFLSIVLFYRRMRRETGRNNGAEGGI